MTVRFLLLSGSNPLAPTTLLNKIGAKIALEIDGAQHQQPGRIVKDFEKDEYLKSLGWNVIRIPWKKQTLEKEINNFLQILDKSSSG